jgi:hypothetical protein
VAGCKGVGALGTPPRPLPDVAVLDDAITAEKRMIARYRAALSGSHGQSAFLGPLLAQHQAHLARLVSRLLDPRATSGGRPPSPAPPAPPVPSLAALQSAEEDAANALVRHLTKVTPSLAQLLASIAASEASHALLLGSRGGAG